MKNLLLLLSLLTLFTACSDSAPAKNLDAKKILHSKCASCHNLDMPPTISDDELAPPMMAVAFHVHNFVTPTDESQRESKAIEFVQDYVYSPAIEKSFCDKDSLKRYGLMPSQKEHISKDELKAIARYLFEYYTPQNLSKMEKAQAKYNALEEGHKIALKYRCLGCHKIDKKIVGPSFKDISKRYHNNIDAINHSIVNGSAKKWKNSHNAIMPPFKKLTTKELHILSAWIIDRK